MRITTPLAFAAGAAAVRAAHVRALNQGRYVDTRHLRSPDGADLHAQANRLLMYARAEPSDQMMITRQAASDIADMLSSMMRVNHLRLSAERRARGYEAASKINEPAGRAIARIAVRVEDTLFGYIPRHDFGSTTADTIVARSQRDASPGPTPQMDSIVDRTIDSITQGLEDAGVEE